MVPVGVVSTFSEVAELVVSVIQGKDLEVNEVTGTVDTYVKVCLTPHPDGRFQTKVNIESNIPK